MELVLNESQVPTLAVQLIGEPLHRVHSNGVRNKNFLVGFFSIVVSGNKLDG